MPDSPLDPAVRPTGETYGQLQRAYDHLNRTLVSGELPHCLITLQRGRRSDGYFSAHRFGRADGLLMDEIALNPQYFRRRHPVEILATLAHEMVHLWQHHHGKPGRGRYHNRQWAAWMKAIGLQPSGHGKSGRKETGDRVDHAIIPGGPFDRAVRDLLAGGFALTWTEEPPAGARASRSGRRVRYVCRHCALKAWAKHDARLICGGDMTPMEPAS